MALGRLNSADFDALWHFDGDLADACGGAAFAWAPDSPGSRKPDQDGSLGLYGFCDIAPGYVGWQGAPDQGGSAEMLQITNTYGDAEAFETTGDITICAVVLCPLDTQSSGNGYVGLLWQDTGTFGLVLQTARGVGAPVQLKWLCYDSIGVTVGDAGGAVDATGNFPTYLLPAHVSPGLPHFVTLSKSGNDITTWVNGRNCGVVTLVHASESAYPGRSKILRCGGGYATQTTAAYAEVGVKFSAVDDAQVMTWTKQIFGSDFARAV